MRLRYRILWVGASVFLAAMASIASPAQSVAFADVRAIEVRIGAASSVPSAKKECEAGYLDPPIYQDGRWWFCGRAYAQRPNYRAKAGWTATRE